MAKRPALGNVRRVLADRAPDALFGLTGSLPKLIEADVATVAPNPAQPRRRLDEAGIAELADSIEQHGLLQPIVVKTAEDGYVLVAGQRRLEAFRRLGRERIPALLTEGRADELALIENLQRMDLDPLDESEAMAALKERYGYTQDQLARVLGKAKSTVSELLSLNALPAALKADVRAAGQTVTKSVLIEIGRLGDPQAQIDLWKRLQGEGATVREARARKSAQKGAVVSEKGRGDASRTLQASGKRLLQLLSRVDSEHVRRDREMVAMLRRIRDSLDDLLGRDARGTVKS